MTKPLFKKGEPFSVDRLEKIEKVVSRIALRNHKTTTAIISPQIISLYSKDVDVGGVRGELLKQLLFKGRLGKCIVVTNKKPKTPMCIEIKLLNDSIGDTKTIYLDKAKQGFNLNINTEDGSMISIDTHPTDEKNVISEMWLSILWTPHITCAKIKQELIDGLEADVGIE